jgi:hypothetical protein
MANTAKPLTTTRIGTWFSAFSLGSRARRTSFFVLGKIFWEEQINPLDATGLGLVTSKRANQESVGFLYDSTVLKRQELVNSLSSHVTKIQFKLRETMNLDEMFYLVSPMTILSSLVRIASSMDLVCCAI